MKIVIEKVTIEMSTTDVKAIIKELFEAAHKEVDAARAALVMFQQSTSKSVELIDSGDVDTARALIVELNESSAALVNATLQNTQLAEHITTADIQAVADTLPDTASAPADGSTIV